MCQAVSLLLPFPTILPAVFVPSSLFFCDQIALPTASARVALIKRNRLQFRLNTQDALLLHAQYGIQLANVLDTQVVYGLNSLAYSIADGPDDGTDRRRAAADAERDARRIGLGALYAEHGFAHDLKEEVAQLFKSSGPGCGSRCSSSVPSRHLELALLHAECLLPLSHYSAC